MRRHGTSPLGARIHTNLDAAFACEEHLSRLRKMAG